MRGLSVLLGSMLLASPALAGDMVPLVSEAKIAEICKGLQPPERQVFPGPLAARSAARTAYETEHKQLRKTHFLIELVWGGFTVAEFDDVEKVVTLATEKPFRAFKGQLALFDAGRDDIELDAVEGELEALKTGLAKGTLSLVLHFKPAEEEGTPCVVSKAKSYAFSVDLLGVELRDGARTVARSLRDDLSPLPNAQGKPTVEIRSAAGQECQDCSSDVVNTVATLLPDYSACYDAALAKRPTLDGSLILDVVSSKAGELSVATVIADSVADADLLTCVKAGLAKLNAVARGAHAQVLVDFSRK